MSAAGATPGGAPRLAGVRALLAAFTPAEPNESRDLARALALLDGREDPFDRRSAAPGHFTASAFVLHPTRAAVLLIAHAKLGRWLQPGGHFEPEDADVWAAAARECREEAGLDGLVPVLPALFHLDIHPIPALRGEPAHEHFDLRVLLRAATDVVAAGSDASAARWVEVAALIDAPLPGAIPPAWPAATPVGSAATPVGDASIRRALRRLPPLG